MAPVTCDYCGGEGTKMKRCPCGDVRYCDKDCQRADWKRHKPSHGAKASSASGSGGGGYRSRLWPFGFPIRSQAQLDRAAEALAAHDKPFNFLDMNVNQMGPAVLSLGGGMADAPKGAPFRPGAQLGLINGELWFFVVSDGGDLTSKPNEDAPHVTESADLTGVFLSYYFNDLRWRGASCFAAEKAAPPPPTQAFPAGSFQAFYAQMMNSASFSEGVGVGFKRLCDLPEEKGFATMKVVAETGTRDLAPLKAYMQAQGMP